MSAQIPQHHLHGTHHQVGRPHREALRPMIRAHLELIMEVAVGPPAEHDYVRDEVPA